MRHAPRNISKRRFGNLIVVTLFARHVLFPSNTIPQFQVIVYADQHHFLVQSRQLSQLRRNANPALAVQLDGLRRA